MIAHLGEGVVASEENASQGYCGGIAVAERHQDAHPQGRNSGTSMQETTGDGRCKVEKAGYEETWDDVSGDERWWWGTLMS